MSVAADKPGMASAWRKSRFSIHNGACVEVAADARAVLVRDSTDPAGLVLRWSGQAWRAFTAVTR